LEFGSQGYMQELMRRVNSDPVFLDLRKTDRNATYTPRLEPEPENEVKEDLTIGFAVVDGKISEVWSGETRITPLTDLVFSGRSSKANGIGLACLLYKCVYSTNLDNHVRSFSIGYEEGARYGG